jgi:uncharacterized protein
MLLESLIAEIRPYYQAQDAGHDWAHITRVVKSATAIAMAEGADLAIVIPAAYLHDIVNVPKNHPQRAIASELSAKKAVALLEKHGHQEGSLDKIYLAILEHSFSRGSSPSNLESACVQDADRLDAIGAIGILRCAIISSQMGSQLYDPADPLAQRRDLDDKKWMLDHYPVKLLKLKDTFNTDTAKLMAQKRHQFMLNFLAQFQTEI